ncbi:MAG: GIY-YIG nuclease family protein [Mangrovibacterium sp.]
MAKDKEQILADIFNSDPLGIIKVKLKSSNGKTTDERLLASFNEINEFVKANNREPQQTVTNINEYQLYTRLKSLREDSGKIDVLRAADIYKLLPAVESGDLAEPKPEYQKKKKEIKSLDDILGDDTLDILAGDDNGLFDLKHVPKETTMPDYVASRKPCKEFDQFEHLFKACHTELTSGKRNVYPFKNEQQIDKGYFFVLKGVMLFVAEVGRREPDENGKVNARLRCIFENGTESDMLLRSLAAELYKHGRRITENEDRLLDNFSNITKEDEEAGFIYVLRSKSTRPEIQHIKSLYKIGYSRTSVEDRIKNADKEPTYLMAPVEYIAGWQCYNLNAQKFEQLIHNFFGNTCLEVDVFDENGKRHTPREWFIAPLPVIEQAVELIISGEIVNYKYDVENSAIALR